MFKSSPTTPEELATVIEGMVAGTLDTYEWDDTMSSSGLSDIKDFCWSLYDIYPPRQGDDFTTAEGLAILVRLSKELRGSPEAARDYMMTFPWMKDKATYEAMTSQAAAALPKERVNPWALFYLVILIVWIAAMIWERL